MTATDEDEKKALRREYLRSIGVAFCERCTSALCPACRRRGTCLHCGAEVPADG